MKKFTMHNRIYADSRKSNLWTINLNHREGLNQQAQTASCSPHSLIWPHKNQLDTETILLLQQSEYSQPTHPGETECHTNTGMWPLAHIAQNTDRNSSRSCCYSLNLLTELRWGQRWYHQNSGNKSTTCCHIRSAQLKVSQMHTKNEWFKTEPNTCFNNKNPSNV